MERNAPGASMTTPNVLPQFPEFKTVELTDQASVKALTAGYPPYADFNFVELFCWNRGDQGGISVLNGNLVIRWEDVVTGELFLTFLGESQIDKTVRELLEYSERAGLSDCLQAVPESVIRNASGLHPEFVVEDDPINWDYLLSTEEWSTISGARFKNKRNAIHRLERLHEPTLMQLNLADGSTQDEIRRICQLWADLRSRPSKMTRAEFGAIENLLLLATELESHDLYAVGAFSGDEMIGFSVNEVLEDGYGLGHFAKADYRYEGIYSYMLRNVAQYMSSRGVELLNIEADLGDPGLAVSKRLCHPVGMLKKLSIYRKDRGNGALSNRSTGTSIVDQGKWQSND
jgi:hypothetical protein